MVGNLVENAAKYGGGRVFVTVERGQGFVDIAVEDDGPGIPVGEREAIFRPWRTARHGKARNRPWPRDRARRCGNLRRAHHFSRKARTWAGCWRGSVFPQDERALHGSSARLSKSRLVELRARSARAFSARFGGVKIHASQALGARVAPVSWRFPRRRSRRASRPLAPGAMTRRRWIRRSSRATISSITSTAAGSSAPKSPPIAPSPASIRSQRPDREGCPRGHRGPGQGSDRQWPPRPADRRPLRELDGRSGSREARHGAAEALSRPHCGGQDPRRPCRPVRRAWLRLAGSVAIFPDLKDPTHYSAYAGQGGLGMPNRDYYLLKGEKYDAYRKAYRDYIVQISSLRGYRTRRPRPTGSSRSKPRSRKSTGPPNRAATSRKSTIR